MSTEDYKPDTIHVEKPPLPRSPSHQDNDVKGGEASHIEDQGVKGKEHHTPAVNIIENPLRVSL